MRDILSRLVRALKLLWWAWRNPPPTPEQMNMARAERSYQIDQRHKMDLAEFDTMLRPLLSYPDAQSNHAEFSAAYERAYQRHFPTQRDIAIMRSHTPREPYMDHVCEGYREYQNGDKVPIPPK